MDSPGAFQADLDVLGGAVAQVEPGVGLPVGAGEAEFEVAGLDGGVQASVGKEKFSGDDGDGDTAAVVSPVVGQVVFSVVAVAPGRAIVVLPGWSCHSVLTPLFSGLGATHEVGRPVPTIDA